MSCVDIVEGLAPPRLAPKTAARLAAHLQGEVAPRTLRAGHLAPGDAGVLRATFVHLVAPREFTRRNGNKGLVARARFADATGEVEMVLWDEEVQVAAAWRPGQAYRLLGVVARAGYRGGVELSLPPVIEEIPPELGSLEGRVETMGATEVVDGRFKAEVTLDTQSGPVHVIVWGPVIKEIRAAGVGAVIRLAPVSEHPLLDQHHLGDDATRCTTVK